MIIDFTISYNNYDEKILNKYNVFSYTCPSCGAKHAFIRHGTYDRFVCFIQNGQIIEKTFTALRLLCKSCKKTHAILPNDIIPYGFYSFSFILNVLTEKLIYSQKTSRICNNYGICFQQIYSFIARFKSFSTSCLFVLKSLGISKTSASLIMILVHLLSYEKNNNHFLSKYFFYCSWPFLMKKFQNILTPPIFIGGVG